MKKYKLEKFAKKPTKKIFIFSQHEQDDWEGPGFERNIDDNVNRFGTFTKDGKFKFEFDIVGSEGNDYVARVLNNEGQQNGPSLVVSNGCLYFGHYSNRDGFHDIVYRFKKGENVRTQRYNHGVLVDECLTDYVLLDEVAVPMQFNPNYVLDEIIERKKSLKEGDVVEYIAGDPTKGDTILAAQVFPDGKVSLGEYSRNAFNGFNMLTGSDGDTFHFRKLEYNNPAPLFELVYSSQNKGYAFIIQKDDGGFLDLIYYKKDNSYEMSIMDLNDRRKPIQESKVVLPNFIDPDAPKPGVNMKIKHKPKKDEKGKTAEERLASLIGVEDAKQKINLLKAVYKKFKNDPKKISLHMCFTGNPGTGKTEVARLFAEILFDAGILEVNKLVETDPSGLVSEYVGKTQIKTHAKVKEAMGGVLFIDEAYNLAGGGYETTDEGNFGSQAISALLKDMEDYQGKFCVILAGYEKQMMDMIESNPGFKSRITNFIDFPNYSLSELKQIAKLMLDNDGYKINDDALEEVIKHVSTKTYKEDFANAREVRNVLQALYTYQALRTSDDSSDLTITIDDVYAYLKKKDPKTESGKTADERLNDLIGLSSVKKDLLGIKALLTKGKTDASKIELNFAFTGNPGTGKTQVANLFADILYDAGILPTRNFVKTNRSGLVAEYEGKTAIKTHKIFHDALGGVLFIDEAYSLCNGAHDEFGLEAIAALIEDMENFRGKICVIIAGYEGDINRLISFNDGFKSRINHWIKFPDYSDDELKQIFNSFIAKDGYIADKGICEKVAKIVSLERQSPSFANARSVRNVFESLKQIQAVRTIEDSSDVVITMGDVKQYEKDHGIDFNKKAVEKADWNVSYSSIKKFADKWDDSYFKFSPSFVEEASVNIRVIKDGNEVGEGSGFFISPEGIIATNYHVAGEADELNVIVNLKTNRGQTIQREYAAELIAGNKEDDVAIVGILNPDIEFQYYRLAKDDDKYPSLLTAVIMGGYPMGGNRFSNITLLEGKVQSINKDAYTSSDMELIYLDIMGHPGSSGSGVIDKSTGRLIGIFVGVSIHHSDPSLKIRRAIPVKYLWKLLKSLKSSKNNATDDFVETYNVPTNNDRDRDDERRRWEERFNAQDVNPFDHIHIVSGDVTLFEGDSVVNTANSRLAAGGGVCGAIFDRAGYNKLKEACQKIGHCDPGKAVITPGFELPAKKIIHVVGPHYLYDKEPEKLLREAYESIFILAMENGVDTLAMPSISTGNFRYPAEEAVPIALEMISHYAGRAVKEVYVYVKGDTAELYKAEFERRKKEKLM